MANHWSARDDAYLRAHFLTSSHANIGIALNRPECGVRNRCYRLGLRKQSIGWTSAEDQRLREWYSARRGLPLSLGELCVVLGRSESDISERAAKFGLADASRPRPDLSARLKKGESGWRASGTGNPNSQIFSEMRFAASIARDSL